MSSSENSIRENFKIFVAISVGSSVAETVGLPLNTIKVMLHLQGEHCKCIGAEHAIRPANYLHTWDAIRKIVQNHHTKTVLTNGLDSIYSRQILYNGVRVATYHPVRELFHHQLLAFNYQCTLDDWSVELPANLTTCAMAVMLCQPTTVIKGRAQSAEPVSRQKFIRLTKRIYREEGLIGFWRATLPVYLRLSVYITLNSYVLEKLRNDFEPEKGSLSWRQFWRAMVTFGLMNVIFVVSANPLDLMSIRIINATPKYRGLYDCMSWTMKNEGFWAFYKGSGASFCCAFIYDMFYFFLCDRIKSVLDKVS